MEARPRSGHLDGFCQNEDAGGRDEGGVVLPGLLSSHGNPLDAFRLADEPLDADAPPMEALGKEAWQGSLLARALPPWGMIGQIRRLRAAPRLAFLSWPLLPRAVRW